MLNVARTIRATWKHAVANYISLSRFVLGLWGLNMYFWVWWKPWLIVLFYVVSSALDFMDGWVGSNLRRGKPFRQIAGPIAG